MLISRETDYALRILRVLQDDQMHNVARLCSSEQIPTQFGYKIIRKLTNAGYVESHRGPSGGIQLKGKWRTASLWDLLCALDDAILVNACLKDGYECQWTREHGECAIHNKLCPIQHHLQSYLESIHLIQLMN